MDAWPLTRFVIDGVEFRPPAASDAESVYTTVRRNAAHLIEFMHWMVPDYSMEMAHQFIRQSNEAADRRESRTFVIFRGDSMIGAIGFASVDWTARKAEVGYWIDRDEQGKGLITRATTRLIDHAFHELGLNKVLIRCSSLNKKSAAVPERLGFKLEGVLRQSEFRNGSLHDFLYFGLLASEWRGSSD